MENIKINKQAFNKKKFVLGAMAVSMILFTGCSKDEKDIYSYGERTIERYTCEEYLYEDGEWVYTGIHDYDEMPLYDGISAYYIVEVAYGNGEVVDFENVKVSKYMPDVKKLIKGK